MSSYSLNNLSNEQFTELINVVSEPDVPEVALYKRLRASGKSHSEALETVRFQFTNEGEKP